MIEKVKERISKKIQIEQEMNQERILNSLDLSDYVVILLKDPYKYKLNNINIEKIKEYFEKIIPIRNRVMHTKPLELGDKAILEEVLETLANGEFVEIQNAIQNTSEMLNETQKEVVIDNNITPKENIINFMKNFKTLLVIDNLETINDNSINEFIKSVPKESNILITSRTGLGELEYRYNLSGMNQNDGIRYFRELSKYYGLDIHKRNDKTIPN